ncbi:glycoside hydrolase family 78 protein [Curvularia clavata]|uniref:Glycoside hydrolase family 78 protein n=1 Tax=Curvularia clavata TaxID=95742 RepID=A0A9Q9DQ13_CURCL|nr:glycoside hydrolase family 78 protein [Curvularia clavata]
MRLSQPVLLASLAGAETALEPTLQSRQLVRQSTLPYPANVSAVPIYATNETLILKGSESTPSVIVLDYGANVEGFPTFQVLSATGDTAGLEITYSESRDVLDSFYMSDGPLGLAAAMDTYRVNQYNISGPLVHTNRLVQGGFRYQKLNLSTTGELILKNVGVKPTIPTTPLDRLSGYFESSDEVLNRIWRVGARTVQLNDIPANSIPAFWQVSEEGALVESQAPQVLSAGGTAAALMQYRLEFEVKPIAKGFAFSVLADTLNSGIYIFCNINNGSISAHFGSTEDSPQIAFATLPRNITTGAWYKVEATVDMTNIAVAIQQVPVFRFSQTSSFFGSFGLGAALGHSAVFRNLSAATLLGELIYSASLTNDSFFSDFIIGTNPRDTTVDGSKRDRIAYAGDLDVALVSSLASTNGVSYVKGTLDLIGSYQLTPGFFAPTAKIQQEPLSSPINANQTGLIGYSFNLLTAVAGFYKRTGDVNLPKEWAPRAIRMLDWANSQVLPESGLLNISNAAFGGDWNYYDAPQSGVVSKFNMAYAYALQECITLLADGGVDTEPYRLRLENLRAAIDRSLWSNELSAYYVSDNIKDGFGQDSNALAILAGVNKNNHTSSSILKSLKQLSTPVGPLAFSQAVTTSGFAKYISPYASAYHLRAAFQSKDSNSVLDLLKSLWAPMTDPEGAYYTGCFWETLNAMGQPALGRTTSLCHGWASGPTGELSEHVLGVSAIQPGYKEWQIAPMTLGMNWARGRLPVPGGEISVAWNATGDIIKRLEVKSPSGTSGTVVVPLSGSIGGTFYVNDQKVNGNGTFRVAGGEIFILTYSM